jgi:hypothetical protein
MLIIAHRGLTDGPDKLLQNTPTQVQHALDFGYDVEIDVWYSDKKYFLGHDKPEHEVDWNWLTQSNMWIHCKNLPAFFDMRDRTIIHNYFWHESDAVVLTSRGNIWTYFGKPETASSDSICVLPEISYNWDEIEKLVNSNKWMGYCTDFPRRIELCQK